MKKLDNSETLCALFLFRFMYTVKEYKATA